jgi:hypothetical protein
MPTPGIQQPTVCLRPLILYTGSLAINKIWENHNPTAGFCDARGPTLQCGCDDIIRAEPAGQRLQHGHVVKSVELTGAPVCLTPSIWSANADLMVGSLTVLTHVQYGCTAVQICEERMRPLDPLRALVRVHLPDVRLDVAVDVCWLDVCHLRQRARRFLSGKRWIHLARLKAPGPN